MITIQVDTEISLTDYTIEDIPFIQEFVNEKEVYDNTMKIPHPYTLKHAKEWVKTTAALDIEHGVQTNWAIRKNGYFIGGIGLVMNDGPECHKDEIGYWLGKPYWGQGIMTKVVSRFTEYCLTERKYQRIQAIILAHNIGSAKVLQKAGFQKEGLMRKAYLKDGQLIDGIIFAKIK